MYVARFTQNPEQDIERGWSGWMFPFTTDLRDALEHAGWVDEDDASDDDLLDLADDYHLREDPHTGAWRPFHHDGLSCFALEAEDIEGAISEAASADIDWSGTGMATTGTVKLVAKIINTHNEEKNSYLWVFECEGVEHEC